MTLSWWPCHEIVSVTFTFTRRTDSIKPILKRLHWLPIVYRIEHKIATLAYKVQETGYPAYLKSAVVKLIPNRTSRSSDKHFLKQFPVKTEIARRAFGQAAPSVLNSLPAFFRSIKQFTEFKKCLKTHFFKLAYPGWSRDFIRAHDSLSA